MTLAINLLGRPTIELDQEPAYRFRSLKSWAVLAFLLMAERPPSRAALAGLLFDAADDPLRSLRWNLAEVRRGLGGGARLEGDPVVLELPRDFRLDVDRVTGGHWADAVLVPELGEEFLEGIDVRGAAGFESWLISERQRLAAASEAVLHEAAAALVARGELSEAVRCAELAVRMSPLDENNQALLISIYRRMDDPEAAARQVRECTRLFASELGLTPGPAVQSAARVQIGTPDPPTGSASVDAILESGSAAVAAGATEAGLASLRSGVALADQVSDDRLRVSSRLVVAEALIHSLRGMDEEGVGALFAADEIAAAHGQRGLQAEIRAELGYVDFLRARYDRAALWLNDALELADGAPQVSAKAASYLGSVESDRADYPKALSLLEEAIDRAHTAGDLRREAYATAMVGRIHLLCGRLEVAAELLDASIRQAERERWLAFLPWPQALRGEVEIAAGRPEPARLLLEQAFARACQIGDPCWEGISARGLAMVAEANGDTNRAFHLLADARVRCNRLADPYVWLDAHILDAQCGLGRRHDHPDVREWADAMYVLSSRTAMREMTVRSLMHAAGLGVSGAGEGARLLAADIDNEVVSALVGSRI